MERLHPDDPSWDAFEILLDQIVGSTVADNAYQMQAGWTAQWLWGSSITKDQVALSLRSEGKGDEARSAEIAAHERRIVVAEILEEIKKMKERV